MVKKPSKDIVEQASCYQYVLNGQTYKLHEMDRGQLMQCLMKAIDLIESIEGNLAIAADAIDRWQRHGEVTTDE